MAAAPLPVAIAGGGIGGLSAALALARQGIASRVCERRPAFSEAGAGIQLGPNGTHILQSLGVEPYLRETVATPDVLCAHDADSGRTLSRMPLGAWMVERHGAPYWTIHRQHLHEALVAAAAAEPLIAVELGRDISDFDSHPDAITVASEDGTHFDASALIAADGLWSRLRSRISGAPGTPSPAGKTAYRAVVPAPALPPALATNAVHIWLSPRGHAVHYPVNGGRDVALIFVVNGETETSGWNTEVAADDVLALAANFAEPLRGVLAAATGWRMWTLGRLAALPRWRDGRAALLGDAAHPTFPFLAQGGVMAMEDAAVLARTLKAAQDTGDVATALRIYADQRRPRADAVVEAARRNGVIYHMAGVQRLARNAVMSVTPGERLIARYDWVYGWRAEAA